MYILKGDFMTIINTGKWMVLVGTALVLGFVLWLVPTTTVVQAASCSPPYKGPFYKLDKSSLQISGADISWAAHEYACGYRVIIKVKATGERKITKNLSEPGYTIPAGTLTDGEEYSVILKMLDKFGHPRSPVTNIAKRFTYAATAVSCGSGPGADDKIMKSTLKISGGQASWQAEASACAYRVILKNKGTGDRVDTTEVTNAQYSLPADLPSGNYSIVIKMLDSSGRVAGKGIAQAFTHTAQ